MQPKSQHWADQMAARIVRTLGDKDLYTCASGITPSGTIHIGNFREAITVDFVVRALRDLGKNVRAYHSWDDFDTLRKVPINLPNQEMLKEHLRRPISRVPDPYGEVGSYAEANLRPFERDVATVGIKPEFLYQHERYGSGMYAGTIRDVLQNLPKIKAILDQFRSEPLADTWLPTSIYCESCDRDTMEYERYDGDWGYSYKCATCKHEATTDIRTTKNLKLNWRCDWPMRWNFEKVDFEPGGKDHSSEGGSFDTASRIIEAVWGRKAPLYLQYDFVSIKGMGGKMSSSKGVLFTLGDALQVYTPQMVRWIFACQRPNTDFSLAFDADVIKVYDEFDRAENDALAGPGDKPEKWLVARRAYELSAVDGKVPATKPYRPGFRELCSRLQICDGNIERTLSRFYADAVQNDIDRANFMQRAHAAWTWLQHHAPDEFRYTLNTKPLSIDLSELQSEALRHLRDLLAEVDLETIATQDLNQQIYDRAIRGSGVDAKEFFRAVYQKLISRDQGPRLPMFLKEIGRQRALDLLT